MPGLLLIAHAPLASALRDVAEHTFPDCARQLRALDVTATMSADDVEMAARDLMMVAPEWLVLTDVFGATPCNGAQRLASPAVQVVAGVNVPMLWRTLCYADQPLDALVARALQGASAGVLPVPPPTTPE
jgi:mannose PTS system EIIA component